MKKKPSRKSSVKNAGPVMNTSSEVTHRTHGIRSNPQSEPWNATASLRVGLNRRRVEISRILSKELPFVGYLDRQIPEEALGDGLSVVSGSKNEKFRIQATELFDLWAQSPKIDVQGRVNFYESQPMLGELVERDGEVLALKVASKNPADYQRSLSDKSFRALQLQFLRRDQLLTSTVGTPDSQVYNPGSPLRWDDGIGMDDLDRAVVFRMAVRDSKDFGPPTAYRDVPASLMLHLRRANLEGVHGTPAMFYGETSALDLLDTRALSKFSDKIRAAFLGAITTPTGDAPQAMKPSIKKGQKPDPDNANQTIDSGVRYYQIEGGPSIPIFKEGETISFFTGTTLSFEAQIALLLKEIAYARRIPPEYLWKLESLGSGAVRMVLRKVKKVLDAVRRPFKNTYCQGAWEFVIGDAINRGELENVPDWNVIECRTSPDPSIDAGRDEKIEQEKLRTFTGTVDIYCDGLGQEGAKVRHARLQEISDNIAYGSSLNPALPWFLCVDPAVIQAVAGIASVMGVDLNALGDSLKKITEGDT